MFSKKLEILQPGGFNPVLGQHLSLITAEIFTVVMQHSKGYYCRTGRLSVTASVVIAKRYLNSARQVHL